MARLRSNFQRGTLTGSITSGDTSISSGEFSALPVVASPDYLMIVLDPDAVHGNPEIVKVTAHTSSATSVTVVRAQEGTTNRSHNPSTTWRHVPTAIDHNYPEDIAVNDTAVWIDVRSRGGKGDGGTTNNRAAIDSALADLSAGGLLKFGTGDYHIKSVDANNNGITLTANSQRVVGAGPAHTTITIDVDATWGIKIDTAHFCGVRDLQVTSNTGRTVTYLCGVSTTSPGSAHDSLFENLYATVNGTTTAAYAVGPDHAGASNLDIADTVFIKCRAAGAYVKGWVIGNGTSGNVLVTSMFGCSANGDGTTGENGVDSEGAGFVWYGGQIADHRVGATASDFLCNHPGGQVITIDGVRSEGSAQFLLGGTGTSPQDVNVRGVYFNDAGYLIANGRWIEWGWGGTLRVDGCNVPTTTGTPVIYSYQAGCSIVVTGLSAPVACASAVTGTFGSMCNLGHTQLDGTTLLPTVTDSFIAPTAWVLPGLSNSWVGFGNPYPAPQYRKDVTGRVEIQGMAKSGTFAPNGVMFTLPVGFRPAKDLSFAVESNGVFGNLYIASNGDVIAQAGNNANFSTMASFSVAP